ncbi:MAG: hypothetical protein IPJ13_10250 [Saprospiraceae bacterium]|nr:hypothetical protein [Saprospiraceae bacterium]
MKLYSVIPYLSVGHRQTSAGSTEYVQAGGDAKIALTPAPSIGPDHFPIFAGGKWMHR